MPAHRVILFHLLLKQWNQIPYRYYQIRLKQKTRPPKTFFQFGATLSDKEIAQQIALRNAARDEKDFQTADKIRDSLIEQGIILDDSSDGTTWKKS